MRAHRAGDFHLEGASGFFPEHQAELLVEVPRERHDVVQARRPVPVLQLQCPLHRHSAPLPSQPPAAPHKRDRIHLERFTSEDSP